jgi:hypothetical protein
MSGKAYSCKPTSAASSSQEVPPMVWWILASDLALTGDGSPKLRQ